MTAIILFFGASASFAQSTPPVSYCLHTTDSTYMKVTISGEGANKKLVANITQLSTRSEPNRFRRNAQFVSTVDQYDYFQTSPYGNDVRQSTYAVRKDGAIIYVTNSWLAAERGWEPDLKTLQYNCQQRDFN